MTGSSFLHRFADVLGREVEDIATMGGAEAARKLESDAWAGKHVRYLLSKLAKGERSDVSRHLEDTRLHASAHATANLEHAMATARADQVPRADELERLWHGQARAPGHKRPRPAPPPA